MQKFNYNMFYSKSLNSVNVLRISVLSMSVFVKMLFYYDKLEEKCFFPSNYFCNSNPGFHTQWLLGCTNRIIYVF